MLCYLRQGANRLSAFSPAPQPYLYSRGSPSVHLMSALGQAHDCVCREPLEQRLHVESPLQVLGLYCSTNPVVLKWR